MIMKKALLTLLLTGFGLCAQTPPFPPLPPGGPAGGALPGLSTNSDQSLQQALRRALVRRTNVTATATAAAPAASVAPVAPVAPAAVVNPAKPAAGVNLAPPAAAINPVKPAADTNLPAVQPSVRRTPRALPAAQPDRTSIPPVIPTAPVAPTPGLPAAPAPTVPPPANAAPPVAAAPVAAAPLSPLEEPLPQGMIDFRSADLSQVLDIYSMMVNRTILRPATLPAPTITLTTRGQLTMGEGIQAIEAVLGLNGIVMVKAGDKFVKAMPEAQGGGAGGRFDTNNAKDYPEMGQFVTHVVQLKYAKPSELVPVLTPFVKIPSAILAIDNSQILVLRDYTENVKRMMELVEKIDVAIPSEFVSEVIPIKYAKAGEIASALNSLSTGGGGASVGGGGTSGTRSTRSSGSSSMGANRMGGMGGYPGQNPGMGNQPGMPGTTPTAGTGSSFSQRLQSIINKASATGDIQVLGQTKIISDERTNSLLIYASREDMKTIQGIVAKLDVVLAQVLIDAAIISVGLDDNHSLGFSYIQQTPTASGNFSGVGNLNNGNSLAASRIFTGATNISTTLPGGFSYLASFGQDLDVTMTAAAGNSRTKILQRPRIQTSHNEPATLFVGSTQPYPTASYYGGGGYGGNTSIQQMQIGVTIEVTPLINPDGLVVMEIHTKIDDVTGSVNIANVGDVPITSSKEASSKVSVRDHDTIILGGMIYTKKARTANGVPLLMDIPLLGYLFRSSSSDDKREELIVLIRPTVLPTPEIAALAAVAEKNKMPGVRVFEREAQADETRRLKQTEAAEKMSPYQPEEKP